jgi:hypothetical protein
MELLNINLLFNFLSQRVKKHCTDPSTKLAFCPHIHVSFTRLLLLLLLLLLSNKSLLTYMKIYGLDVIFRELENQLVDFLNYKD